eukprot:7242869-Alexandrium_andersonii.AAC.1
MQVSFVFAEMSSKEVRENVVSEVVKKFYQQSDFTMGHFLTGPRNDRKLSKASYVQFRDPETARLFLQNAGGKNKVRRGLVAERDDQAREVP